MLSEEPMREPQQDLSPKSQSNQGNNGFWGKGRRSRQEVLWKELRKEESPYGEEGSRGGTTFIWGEGGVSEVPDSAES